MWCEVGFVSLMELLLSVYLHVIVLHVAGGCILTNHGRELKIEADSSDAVLLPCYCADSKTTFLWKKMHVTSRKMLDCTDGKRVQMVVGSPGNFSLLISNLTVEDGGLYRCESRAGHYTDIRLIVKGSTEIIARNESTITAHAGTSALLPCHSTELNTKPNQFLWRKYSRSKATWDDMSSDGQKFQLLNDRFPGNLSLLISHLTREDEGVYRCDLGRDQYTDVKLVVKGCNLEKLKNTEEINAHMGDTVLLKCTCSDLQIAPPKLTWKKYKNPYWDSLEINNQQRFQLSNVQSPGNLSLLILQVSVEDKGLYRCQIQTEIYKDFDINVTGVKVTEPSKPPSSAYLSFIPVVLLLGIGGVIFWRYRVKKREQTPSSTEPTGQKKEQETQDDVIMYTTVVHSNTTQRHTALSTDERTEYAVIKLN